MRRVFASGEPKAFAQRQDAARRQRMRQAKWPDRTRGLAMANGPTLGAVLALLGVTIVSDAATAQPAIPPPQVAKPDMLVGAYYFPGWSREQRWYCIKASEPTLHPLLGYYREGEPGVADWHIKWALEHGVSFFAFDYYIEDGGELLESALADGFLNSRFIDRFRFCLNWCNHAPAETQTRQEFEAFEDVVIDKYLKHPSYLRIEDKPVVMILAGYSFVKTLGVEGAREMFQAFDARCKAAGLNGVHLVFCEGGINGQQAIDDSLAAGAKAFCLYNYPYAGTRFTGPGQPGAEATYEDMIAQGERLWKHWRNVAKGAFWPTVMPGWDRRPWTKDRDLIRTGSTPDLFERSLRAAREHVNQDRIVMIEAWNEWGEGSILEPSQEQRFAYLQKVREVFCPGAEPLEPQDPATLGLQAPVFDVKLPSVTRWTFDFDNQGWTGARCAELVNRQGVLLTSSTTGDPALSSPPNYVRCADHQTVRVRMRLTPQEGTERKECIGQVFWSTVDRQMCEETSATFTAQLDGKWHVHEVDLAGKPAWTGTADSLRLDPCDAPDIKIAVDRLEFR
jgi:hypothetical protein